jgi:Zn-dependent peptidase ImmA (M78 family)
MTLEQWEDEMIREALRRANGNKSQAARLLGLSRNALRYRLSKIGIADEGRKAEVSELKRPVSLSLAENNHLAPSGHRLLMHRGFQLLKTRFYFLKTKGLLRLSVSRCFGMAVALY